MPNSVSRHLLSDLAPDVAAHFADGVALRVHTSFEQTEARWRAAQAGCAAYGFQTYDWLATWQRALGQRQGWEVFLVELSDADERTLMLLPLGRQRRYGLRIAGFLGGEVTDYNAPLLRAGFDASAFAALWPVIMRLLGGVDIFRARRVPSHIDGVINPMTMLENMRQTEQAHAATLPADYEAFQAQRGAKMFADTRRQLRRLAERGAVQLLIDVPAAQRAAVIAGMARQKTRRWRETSSRDLFAEQGYLQFYQELTVRGIVGGDVAVSALYVGSELIATHWGMRYGKRFYWLMPGYQDGEWARYSPGRVLLDGVVRHCIDEGLEIFDLTAGDEAYKLQWADHTLPLYAGQQAYSLRGRFALALDDAWQRLRARARGNERLRRLVRRLRKRHSAASSR